MLFSWISEQMRKTDRVVRQTQRDMNRERAELERMEKKLQQDIKVAAKQGNKQVQEQAKGETAEANQKLD